MRLLLKQVLFCCLVLSVNVSANEASDILKRSDQVRNPDVPFSSQTTLVEYNQGIEVDRLALKVFSKKKQRNGQFRSLVSFLKPERDAGKLMLQSGNEIWFYDPSAMNSIRLSAQQRLMGQASNGDVMTSNFVLDYNVELKGEAVIKDVKRKVHKCYHLYLVAKNKGVTYASADYWVDKKTSYPVKIKFYSSSKRLMKIAYYTDFRQQLGSIRPTQVLIIDGVDPKKVTRMKMHNYRAEKMPEAWFQRSYLPRFKG